MRHVYKLERIGILDRESCSIEDERSTEWPRVHGSAEKLNIHVACGGRSLREQRVV